MGDMGDIFREMKKEGQQARERNRDNGPKVLDDEGIRYEAKNGGTHLIVHCSVSTAKGMSSRLIDYWPGTGLWIDRKTQQRKRGVFNLVKHVKKLGEGIVATTGGTDGAT